MTAECVVRKAEWVYQLWALVNTRYEVFTAVKTQIMFFRVCHSLVLCVVATIRCNEPSGSIKGQEFLK